ncbi:porin [Aquimarina macrocephali]|uniref:porin n=1 Tax=Aquimarina macrocephali TaxID=666563 RepID=UPI000467630F|nr:porin [Aquimarina macrocephali]
MKNAKFPLIKAMVLVLALLQMNRVYTQTTAAEETKTSETQKKESNWIDEITSRVTPYGSIRIGAGFTEEGEIGISNNAPRVGLKFKHALSNDEAENFNIIGGIEFGLNLVSRDDTVEFAVDPGAGIAQVGDAVFTRLGFAGVSYRDFEFTFGKQNSVYYTMGATEIDRFLALGGAAIGVWNISDGGVSGTGRANQVFILKYQKNGLSLGVQAEARNISENSESIDTYGFGANYKIGGFGIGVGYNKVNDGVEDPLPNQAKDGDEAFVTSASFEKGRFTVAVSYSILKQHQRLGDVFYDAKGVEFYARYKFSTNKRWHFATGFNYLKPDDDQNLGDFDTKFGIAEVGYNFKKSSHIFAATKIELSENSIGNRRNQSVFGIGIRFGF